MIQNSLKVIKRLSVILFSIAAVLYPAMVYYFLAVRNIPLRHFSVFIIAFALIAFFTVTSKKKSFLQGSLVLLAVGILCLITNSSIILKFYPLLMNVLMFSFFFSTLFIPPNMIFRFATMQDKSIKGSMGERKVEAYCKNVTLIWCGFFIINGSIAAWTIFSGSDILWSVYNGGISYVLIGLVFTGEFIIRKMTQKNIPKAIPISAFKNNSRPLASIICYEGIYSESKFKTWGDFLEGTAKLRIQIKNIDGEKWLLYCDDIWLFLLSFTALLQCKKEIVLSANTGSAFIEEIHSGAPVLTDNEEYFTKLKNIHYIPKLLNADIKTDSAENVPQISADNAAVIMYTSGSTGKPKEVRQRLTELENDNRFILSKWGEEVLKRKFISTAGQHHIYGLLFTVLLPFTAGVPFRRNRIDFPEELENFYDAQYTLVTVPAFLKRAVEINVQKKPCLNSPWIFSSGGVLDPKTAQKARDVFGFWPVEIYGSTETSGIAWRQSCNGLEWTIFDNVQLSVNQDGCLNIISPYIKEKEGFQTSDMAEILKDGRFLLKGRIDSVVKIEEKRISTVEMENRILQSGIVSDVCVIPIHDRRQYLAAAIVFNKNGKEQFYNLSKNDINNYWKKHLGQYFDNIVIPKKWRYLDALPLDSQGKKKKDDIMQLFNNEKKEM